MQFPSGNSPQVPQEPQEPQALVSPDLKASNGGMVSSFKFSAGGGLLAGIVAGFVVLSGASEPVKEVNATKKVEAKTVAVMGDNTGPELVESATTNVERDPSDPELIDPDALVAAAATTPEATDSLPKYSVMFQIRPAILRDTIAIEVDGAAYDLQSFYSLALKPGQKFQKIRVTARAEGYRDFKGSQVIRRDDQFIIQMKEKPVIPATVVTKTSKPKTSKPKTSKPKTSKPKTSKPKTSKPRKPRSMEPKKPQPTPSGPGSLISL